MIADTGAKNGRGCPNTSVAITHARPAATPAWTIERHDTRSRSSRVRIETRDRSAASSISGPARSPNGRASRSRRRGTHLILARRSELAPVLDQVQREHRLPVRIAVDEEAL